MQTLEPTYSIVATDIVNPIGGTNFIVESGLSLSVAESKCEEMNLNNDGFEYNFHKEE